MVVFERDDVLLRRKNPPRDLMLGDINDDLVAMLRRLRAQNVLFGFISDQRGMAAASRGLAEYAPLTKMLDDLLTIRGAAPDFWIAWDISLSGSKAELQSRSERSHDLADGMILRALEWYDADKNGAVIVSSSLAGTIAAKGAAIAALHYSGWRSSRSPVSAGKTDAGRPASSPEITDIQQLYGALEQILGLVDRRSA
ncbi:hypothetical protein [Neorhizobium sp. DT-125]|uniref:hypothetical protein n=1 Tax=Neorhizobium sp. DT-125 TaxID=3396163 RepID=UPI003F1AA2FC